MDNTTILIINLIFSIIASLSPVLHAFSFFIKHIKKSKCYGIESETRSPTKEENEIEKDYGTQNLNLTNNNKKFTFVYFHLLQLLLYV